MKTRILIVTVAVLVAMIPRVSQAADFPTAMAKSISQIPDGADVASMGNASTGLTSDYSTRNPGAVDATDAQPRNKAGFSATYANISFKHGPSVNLYILSGAVRLPVGTLQVSYSDGGSNVGAMDEFNTLKFNNFPTIEAQYGLRLGKGLLLNNDELYAGVGYAYSRSKLSGRSLVPISETMLVFDSVSESTSNTFQTGLLYRIAKQVNLGAVYMHSWDKATDTVDGFSETTRTHTDQLRFGTSVKLTSHTLIAADYRHLYLPKGEHDDQFSFGLEQFLIKDALALYGGYADGGLTTGLGLYLPFGGINVGYMHRPLRATEEFLGRAEAWMFSVYGNF